MDIYYKKREASFDTYTRVETNNIEIILTVFQDLNTFMDLMSSHLIGSGLQKYAYNL